MFYALTQIDSLLCTHDPRMKQRDSQWMNRVLALHGHPDGKSLDCFGSAFSPEDFLYFTVYPDKLSISLSRIFAGLASFSFDFQLCIEPDGIRAKRILMKVEGNNQRIRKRLGEPYSKANIGKAFEALSEEEVEWIEVALDELHRCWMSPNLTVPPTMGQPT